MEPEKQYMQVTVTHRNRVICDKTFAYNKSEFTKIMKSLYDEISTIGCAESHAVVGNTACFVLGCNDVHAVVIVVDGWYENGDKDCETIEVGNFDFLVDTLDYLAETEEYQEDFDGQEMLSDDVPYEEVPMGNSEDPDMMPL